MTVRVLIADDHPWIREGLRYAFEHTEFEIVAEAENTEQAIRCAMEQSVDLAIVDIEMPDRSGIETLAQIKAARPNLAVVVYSDFDRPEKVQQCLLLGAHSCLRKGVEKQALIDAAREAVGGRPDPNA